MAATAKSKVLPILIICITVLLLSGIGAWVYMSRQQLAQKNQQFQKQLDQDKELKKYEEEQQNLRQSKEDSAKATRCHFYGC